MWRLLVFCKSGFGCQLLSHLGGAGREGIAVYRAKGLFLMASQA